MNFIYIPASPSFSALNFLIQEISFLPPNKVCLMWQICSPNTTASISSMMDFHAYLENPVEISFVYSQEVATVFTKDDGGSTGGIVHKCQLAKVITFV